MKGLILIYPLRGTNKQSTSAPASHAWHLSPAGDERTYAKTFPFRESEFIPYGGRTNVRQDVSISRKRIYPLRGDERTFNGTGRKGFNGFIPYGGRTNFIADLILKYCVIYPLRGTNELFHRPIHGMTNHLSPTGDGKNYHFIFLHIFMSFIPCGGRKKCP